MRAIAILIPLLIMGCASNKVVEPPPLLNGGLGIKGDFRRVDTVRAGDQTSPRALRRRTPSR